MQCSCVPPATSTRPAPHLRLFYSFVNFIEQNNITMIVAMKEHKIIRMDVDIDVYIYSTVYNFTYHTIEQLPQPGDSGEQHCLDHLHRTRPGQSVPRQVALLQQHTVR